MKKYIKFEILNCNNNFLGLRFALREGGKTIAAGVITKCLPDEK